MLPDSGLKDCISSPLPHLCFVPPKHHFPWSPGYQPLRKYPGWAGSHCSQRTGYDKAAGAEPRGGPGRGQGRVPGCRTSQSCSWEEGGCYANAAAYGVEGGGEDAPLPRGPLVAKTDHSPRTVAWKRRCHSSLSVTVSQPAARRCWVKMCRTQHFCLPSHQSPPHERAWRLSLHQRGRRNNWIGCLQKPISCSSLGTGGWGRLQTVFVTGLGPSHPADRP